MSYKIFTLLDDLTKKYAEPISRVDGLVRNPKEIIRTIEFYTSNKYLSGNQDELGREKPFYNVCNFRVTTAKTATDIDVKDIKYEADSLKYSTQAMLINHELYKYLKEINFSQKLNEMGLTRPKYGGVLIKKYDDPEHGVDIQVVDWVNVDFDPNDIENGIIIETHRIKPGDLVKNYFDVWYGYDDMRDVLKEHAKLTKNKPQDVVIKEITGEFSLSHDPDIDYSEENDYKFKRMCFYVAVLGTKHYLLYKEDLKKGEKKYKYLAWEKMGNGLGRGIVEEGMEAQVWTNNAVIAHNNAMELAGKVVIASDSQKVKGNVITGVQSGHIFELEPGRTVTSLNLSPSAMPEFSNVIDMWSQQYDRVSSTFNANTGEAPTANTPYSQTALLNQVANSPFEYQREVWGIWLNEVLNEWIYPELRKRITKEHYLLSEFDADELEVIDRAIAEFEARKTISDAVKNGKSPTLEEYQATKDFILLNKPGGAKRELRIPEGFLDVEGNITANITGELRNKGVILQSLDSILNRIIQTYDPNTGQFMLLQDKTLSKIFGTIVEMTGIPLSFDEIKGPQAPQMSMPTQPTTPDASAVSPLSAQPTTV